MPSLPCDKGIIAEYLHAIPKHQISSDGVVAFVAPHPSYPSMLAAGLGSFAVCTSYRLPGEADAFGSDDAKGLDLYGWERRDRRARVAVNLSAPCTPSLLARRGEWLKTLRRRVLSLPGSDDLTFSCAFAACFTLRSFCLSSSLFLR